MQSIRMTKVQSVHQKVRSMILLKHQIRFYHPPPGPTNSPVQIMPSYNRHAITKCHESENVWLIIFLTRNLKKLKTPVKEKSPKSIENEDVLHPLQNLKPNATKKLKILKTRFRRAPGSIFSRYMDRFSNRTPEFYQKSISICMIHAVWRHCMRHVLWAMPNLPWF